MYDIDFWVTVLSDNGFICVTRENMLFGMWPLKRLTVKNDLSGYIFDRSLNRAFAIIK